LRLPVGVLVRAVSTALFVAVLAAALFGTTEPLENLAPTWIYVIVWLGVPVLSVLLGDVWRVLSPWRAIADAAVWSMERSGYEARPISGYPERLGRWPAALALFAFAVLELAYAEPASPRALAVAIAVYSYVTFVGMAAYGRDTWTDRGEAFAVLFGLFARMAPLYLEEGRLRARWPFTGLAGTEHVRGTTAFVAVMLGSVAFDGFSRSIIWQNWLIKVESPYVVDSPTTAELAGTGLAIGGILAGTLLVAAAYALACRAAGVLTESRDLHLGHEFLLSLVPIAFVYELAHYFSLFIYQGQFTIRHLSDPLGKGWNLFGSAGFEPNIGFLSPNTIWYVQAVSLVVGHMAGLSVAHDRAVVLFGGKREVLRSQVPLLALMVLYTAGGLWLLSRG
jgi:hypothetical protein